MSTAKKQWVAGCAMWLALGAPAFARFQPQPCKNAFSEQQEIDEGRKAAAEVYKQMPVLPDSDPVSQYVQQLGAKLVRYAPGYKWPYNFHVANVADINAFALPGGTVFVNLGTIQAAETEAQLAGVMAHEISHVVQRHSTCNATKQRSEGLWAGLGQLAAGVVLPGAAGQVVQQGIGMGAGLHFLKMSRGSEQQADLMGTDILYDAGYDPRAMPQFFETIQGKYGEGGAQFLSDHPNPGNRIGYVGDEIATLPPKANYVKTSAEFARIKQRVAGMHAYTAKEVSSGVWKRGGAAGQPVSTGVNEPSGAQVTKPAGNGWQTLEAANFRVNIPEDWKSYGQQGATTMIAPPGGVGDDGSGHSTLNMGALIDAFQPSSQGDAGSATRELLSQMTRDNPKLRCGNMESVSVNGATGQSADCTNGQERDWVVALDRGDNTVQYAVFVAPADQFGKVRPTYEQMLRSLHLK